MNAAALCTTLQQAVPPSSFARLPHCRPCACAPQCSTPMAASLTSSSWSGTADTWLPISATPSTGSGFHRSASGVPPSRKRSFKTYARPSALNDPGTNCCAAKFPAARSANPSFGSPRRPFASPISGSRFAAGRSKWLLTRWTNGSAAVQSPLNGKCRGRGGQPKTGR